MLYLASFQQFTSEIPPGERLRKIGMDALFHPFSMLSGLSRGWGGSNGSNDESRYQAFNIEGISYRVRRLDSPDPRGTTAFRLREVNETCIEIIAFLRSLLDANVEGRLLAEDAALDYARLGYMYNNLMSRYNPDAVYESIGGPTELSKEEVASGADGSRETSYVINQGEEIHMCVEVNGQAERKSVLVAVLAHELSHVASSTPDHDNEFWDNYDLMQKVVARMGYVLPEDVPDDGGVHCARIQIGRNELQEITRKGLLDSPSMQALYGPDSGSKSGTSSDIKSHFMSPSSSRSNYIRHGPHGEEEGFEITNPVYDNPGLWQWPILERSSCTIPADITTCGLRRLHGPTELCHNRELGFASDKPIILPMREIRGIHGTSAQAIQGINRPTDLATPLCIGEYSRWMGQ
jgi:hypothetical protein